jgi:hypothetical protein
VVRADGNLQVLHGQSVNISLAGRTLSGSGMMSRGLG